MSFFAILILCSVYFIFFHRDIMIKLNFSSRDEAVLMLGLFCAVCLRSVGLFIDSLLIGIFDISSLVCLAVFMFMTKQKYDSL
jgi:predicted tellurium resistance membrane protein TerC